MSECSLVARPSVTPSRRETERIALRRWRVSVTDRLLTTAYRPTASVRPMRQSVTDRGKSDPGSEETEPSRRRCRPWFDLPQETVEWDGGAGAGWHYYSLSVCRWHCTASRSQRSFVPLADRDHPRCVCRSPIGVPNSIMMKHIQHKMWFCNMYRDRLKNGP